MQNSFPGSGRAAERPSDFAHDRGRPLGRQPDRRDFRRRVRSQNPCPRGDTLNKQDIAVGGRAKVAGVRARRGRGAAQEDRMERLPSDLDCRECIDLLAEYVDGLLPKATAELLEWHLEGCAPCIAFLNTYKGTVDAAKRLRETKLPPELRQKLVAFLKRSEVAGR